MYDFEKKIDGYTEEVFLDLGLSSLPEEKKAEIFARVQDHIHKVILDVFEKVLSLKESAKIKQALEQENYHGVSKILKKHGQFKNQLEDKIDKEFNQLKQTITEEQKHAGTQGGAAGIEHSEIV
ncbi:MAG: hypothetical protein U1C57_02605 [Candidatus Doudnabacteria bacterium]|nr:hypothetical protein [bacterium]MDZ4243973.1 hypothetical protein [Candidatus Doudnabacteria bacterium]